MKVFISYIKENENEINVICDAFRNIGIDFFLDRNDIQVSERWEDSIRNEIRNGTFFLACFSREYNLKYISYINEELNLAIDELRLRSTDKSWFIPIKLNQCEIPNLSIGEGEFLSDIQWIDLSIELNRGLTQLARLVKPTFIDYKDIYDENEALLFRSISFNNKKKSTPTVIGFAGQPGIGKTTLVYSLGAKQNLNSLKITGKGIINYFLYDGIKVAAIPLPFRMEDKHTKEIENCIYNNVSIICYVVDVSSKGRIYRDDKFALMQIEKKYRIPYFIVFNKIDLLDEIGIMKTINSLNNTFNCPVFPVSAYRGTNVNLLKDLLLRLNEVRLKKQSQKSNKFFNLLNRITKNYQSLIVNLIF
jgi:small GTP-binding protein